MDTVLNILGVLQWVFLALIVVGLPLRYVLRLRREAAQHAAQAVAAEDRAIHAEATLDQVTAHLSDLKRKELDQLRFGARPMENPPAGLLPTFERLCALTPDDSLAFPVGWEIVQGQPGLVYASFDPESLIYAGNTLLTAKTRFGKDNSAFHMLWTVCRRNTPDRVQIYFLDGKKSDGGLWANQRLAHNLYEPALGEDDIGLAVERLRTLRQTRENQRVQLGVTKWSEIPLGQRPPLIIVFISELDLLEKGMPQGEKLEDWLNSELTTCLASGIVYIVSSQTVANRNTRWRQQCLLYVAGFQDVEVAVAPNFGMTSREIEELGGVSPINFSGAGYFVARINRAVSTVRSARLDLNDRRMGIAHLPKLPIDQHLVDPLIREKVSMLSTESQPAMRGTVPAYRDAPLPADPWLKHALAIDERTGGTVGIAQPDAVPAGIDQAAIAARRTALEAHLDRGEELSDEDILFLHQVCRWSPWKLADRGAKRGTKGDRRKKVDAILANAAQAA